MPYQYIAGVSELADTLRKRIEKSDYDQSWQRYKADLDARRLQWAIEKDAELQAHVAPLAAEILKVAVGKRGAHLEAAVTLLRHAVSQETT